MEQVASYYSDGTLPPIAEKARPVAESVAAIAAPPGADLEPVAPVYLEGLRGYRAIAPPPVTANLPQPSPWESPILAGRMTAFMLMYGDFPDMHRQALTSLLRTTPRERLEVRVASNALCAESAAFVDKLVAEGQVACHYASPTNDRKYPVMRRIFRDPARPIDTPYLLWLDDDTVCDVDPDWLEKLATLIVAEHPKGARLFGPRYTYELNEAQRAWVKAAPWYRGRPFQDATGREAPNGSKVVFASGSLWALATDVMRQQDIPDARLGHNGGDVLGVGAPVWQGGWSMRAFAQNKTQVRWSSYSRRGLSERHPGT